MFEFIRKSKQECFDTQNKPDENRNKIIFPSISEKPVRKVIEGYLYDTSKSKQIITKDTLGPFVNFRCALFLTPNNRFFTVDSFANVRVLEETEAKEFLSEFPEKYQEIFGNVEEA